MGGEAQVAAARLAAVATREEPGWVVDSVRGYRQEGGMGHWEVWWEGFDEPTWEPHSEFYIEEGGVKRHYDAVLEYCRREGLPLPRL